MLSSHSESTLCEPTAPQVLDSGFQKTAQGLPMPVHARNAHVKDQSSNQIIHNQQKQRQSELVSGLEETKMFSA